MRWQKIADRILLRLYAAITITNTTLHMVSIAHTTPMKVVEFKPPMFLCVLNAMLTGTIAGAIAQDQPPAQRVPILVAGVGFQGLGWIVCMIFLTFTIGNLLEKGWPLVNLRPGLFILTGTTGFTIVALISCAKACPQGYGFFATHPTAPEVLLIVAVWDGVFMWVFSLWGFGLAFFITVLGLFKRDSDKGKWDINMTFGNVGWSMLLSRCVLYEALLTFARHDFPQCRLDPQHSLPWTGVGERWSTLGQCGYDSGIDSSLPAGSCFDVQSHRAIYVCRFTNQAQLMAVEAFSGHYFLDCSVHLRY